MVKLRKDYIFFAIQLELFFVYFFHFSVLGFPITDWLSGAREIIFLTGICILIPAFISLNKNLSPFPTPIKSGRLVKSGIYKLIRHPIYTGILFLNTGYGLFSGSSWRLIISVLLFILFRYKAAYEEQLLQNTFSNYATYLKTIGLFLPKLTKTKF